MQGSEHSIQKAANLFEYFKQELTSAFEDVGISTTEDTEAYLVYLLEGFTRIDPSYAREVGFEKPAAILLGEAMNSPGDRRIEAYRRLGDVSLFNCGFFTEHLTRRTVSAEYYRNVGRVAYDNLGDLLSFKQPGGAFEQIFTELAAKFDQIVAAFGRLGRRPEGSDEQPPMSELDNWRRGDSVNLRDLRAAGWMPSGDKGDA